MPVQWANGKHFCQERSIQNDLGTSQTLSDSTPRPWIDINSYAKQGSSKIVQTQILIDIQGKWTYPPCKPSKEAVFSVFSTSLPAQSKTQSGQQQSLDATQEMIMNDDSQIMAIKSDTWHTANAKSPHKLSLNMSHHTSGRIMSQDVCWDCSVSCLCGLLGWQSQTLCESLVNHPSRI